MALQSKVFQDATYSGRSKAPAAILAGSGAQSIPKFVAYANLLLMSLSVYQTVAGTSTYTNTVTGVGTSTIKSQQLSLIVITNTASFGATAALSTTTIGPFLSGGSFASGGTGTGQVGGVNQYALNTGGDQGGVPVAQGSLYYIVHGTDATSTEAITIDFQVAQGAPVTI